ncbi:hypothetical protein C0Q70_13270 [Pomacea canaliculata]|uniref:Uncharacterized protein n=1 Tax=Pomacea canaliculata TaxID=400727 RepID=A0A2T7NWR2_POMCA|nr:hypothetical protein C0Q70_13270 [Pomacea canaliculata]
MFFDVRAFGNEKGLLRMGGEAAEITIPGKDNVSNIGRVMDTARLTLFVPPTAVDPSSPPPHSLTHTHSRRTNHFGPDFSDGHMVPTRGVSCLCAAQT